MTGDNNDQDGGWPPQYKRAPGMSDEDLEALDRLCVLCTVLLAMAAVWQSVRGPWWPGFAAGWALAGLATGYACWRARRDPE